MNAWRCISCGAVNDIKFDRCRADKNCPPVFWNPYQYLSATTDGECIFKLKRALQKQIEVSMEWQQCAIQWSEKCAALEGKN